MLTKDASPREDHGRKRQFETSGFAGNATYESPSCDERFNPLHHHRCASLRSTSRPGAGR